MVGDGARAVWRVRAGSAGRICQCGRHGPSVAGQARGAEGQKHAVVRSDGMRNEEMPVARNGLIAEQRLGDMGRAKMALSVPLSHRRKLTASSAFLVCLRQVRQRPDSARSDSPARAVTVAPTRYSTAPSPPPHAAHEQQ